MSMSLIITMAVWWSAHASPNVSRKLLCIEVITSSLTCFHIISITLQLDLHKHYYYPWPLANNKQHNTTQIVVYNIDQTQGVQLFNWGTS